MEKSPFTMAEDETVWSWVRAPVGKSAIMTLKQYLSQQGMPCRVLAEKIGVKTETVWRYAKTGRVPRPDILNRIVEATDGTVQHRDFYSQGIPGEAA